MESFNSLEEMVFNMEVRAMKKQFMLVLFTLVLLILFIGCSGKKTTQPTTAITTESTNETITTDGELNNQMLAIYNLVCANGAFTGTYEEWLESITGPEGLPGEDGREVLLRVDSGYLQWQYEGDASWINLLDLATLTGAKGEDGASVILQIEAGVIQWSQVGSDVWNNLITLEELIGPAGSAVVLQVEEGYIQWKNEDQEIWNNLISLDLLMGNPGLDGQEVLFQVADGYIQWQYTDDLVWNNIISLDSLTGIQGETGPAGKEIVLQVIDNYIMWQYEDEIDWYPLVSLDTLTGDAGEAGAEVLLQVIDGYIQWQHAGDLDWINLIDLASLAGKDGREVTFRIFEGFIQWQYAGDLEWFNLLELSLLAGTDGADGLSAYEIYLKYNPTYVGTEEQWLNDLINGLLGSYDGSYVLTFYDLGYINFKEIASGGNHTLAISANGRLYAFGQNNYGQIGDGTTINRPMAIDITDRLSLADDEELIQIACGFYNSYTLTSHHRLFSWGYNYNGQLANGNFVDSSTPIDITANFPLIGDEKIVKVIPGFYHMFAMTSTNRIFAWGGDYFNQLGTAGILDRNMPIEITAAFGLSGEEYITDISAGGWHTFAISSTGRVFTWGHNEYGQLGIGTDFDSETPINSNGFFELLSGETIEKMIAGSRHSFAITSTGRVLGWGDNSRSQLGCVDIGMSAFLPYDITAVFTLEVGEVMDNIVATGDYSLGITSFGKILSWGNNFAGQLGDGTFQNRSTPMDITSTFLLANDETMMEIADGHFHSVALSSSGRLYVWGSNEFGQLGNNTYTTLPLADDMTVWVPIWREIISYGIPINYRTLPLKTGFNFMGWYYEPIFLTESKSAYMTAGDVDLYARWELLDTYIIDYVSNGGTYINSDLVIEGSILPLPVEPSKTGYSFAGWYLDAELLIPYEVTAPVVSALTLYAKWDINQYTIDFEENGGSEVLPITQDYATTVTAPLEPTRYGYTFSGWYSDITLITPYVFTTIPAENITLYAKWTPVVYNIIYNLDGGTNGANPLTYNIETPTIILANPTKLGYSFLGWYGNAEFTGDMVVEILLGTTGDVTLYAKWAINQYTLYFESNSGSFVDPITQDYGTIITEPIEPTRLDYTFSGWYSDWELTTPFVFNTMPAEDLTLYAKWIPVEYNIIYNLDGGINGANPLTYNIETPTITLADPTKEGYTFNGWYGNAEFSGDPITQILLGTTGDIALYAKWTINQYTITYDIYDSYDPLVDIPLAIDETISQESFGYYHSAVLTSKGRIFIWGINVYGQLGDGTVVDKYKPLDITSKFNLYDGEVIEQISLGGYHSSAVTSLGRIFTWGFNVHGQLGDGTSSNRLTPVDITAKFNLSLGETISEVNLGAYFSSAITSSGRIFTWGQNTYCQIADGTVTDRYLPVDITAKFTFNTGEVITQMVLGTYHAAVLTSEGRLFTWGGNTYGQLGDGTNTIKSAPFNITANFGLGVGETIVQISLGEFHSAAITSLGRIFTFGFNQDGELGDGTLDYKLLPTDITSQFTLNVGEIINQVSLGDYHSSAITSEGRLFTWGKNTNGQLGDGTIVNSSVPINITAQFSLAVGETITSACHGASHSSAIISNGKMFTWGNNSNGQLGYVSASDVLVPTIVPFKNAFSSETVVYNYQDTLVEYIPTRDGFTFDGWYIDDTLTTLYTFTTMPPENIVLYARWI